MRLHAWEYVGLEWIYFTNFSGGKYKFYVKWDGTPEVNWNNSGAKLMLYYNSKFLKMFTPPKTDSKGQYWEVFTMGNGGRKAVDEIAADEPDLD